MTIATSDERPAVLVTSSLSAGYNDHPIVRDLDLVVHPGEVVALLGANGAGKSTTLNTLAGLLPPIGGEVFIDQRRARSPLHSRARRGLGFVSESRSVFMRMTTADNLRVGRCDERHALEVFPELEPLMDRKAGQLSGGEQQILTLARALARRPTVLLADELSLGLAPKVVVRLLQAVRQAADDGMGVLLVEQHVHQVLRFADRVYVLDRGRISMSGTADEVRPELQKAYLGKPESV